jgi:hypothetical protein
VGGGGGVAAEGAAGGGELIEERFGEEVNDPARLDVVAAFGDGAGYVLAGGVAGLEGGFHEEAAAFLFGADFDFGRADAAEVFLEVRCEGGVERGGEFAAEGVEEVEDLAFVAEPPAAVGGFPGEVVALEEGGEVGVERVGGAGGGLDAEEVAGAVDERLGVAAGFLGERCGCGRGGFRGRGGGGGVGEVFGDAGEEGALPGERGVGLVGEGEGVGAGEGGEEFAELAALELGHAGPLAAAGGLEGGGGLLVGGDEAGAGAEAGLVGGERLACGGDEEDADDEGVAGGGLGEVGGQQEAEFPAGALVLRGRFWRWGFQRVGVKAGGGGLERGKVFGGRGGVHLALFRREGTGL